MKSFMIHSNIVYCEGKCQVGRGSCAGVDLSGRCYARSQVEGRVCVYSVQGVQKVFWPFAGVKGRHLNSAYTVNEGKVVLCGFVAILPPRKG